MSKTLTRPGKQKKRGRGVKISDPNSHTRAVKIKKYRKGSRWGN